MNKYLLIILSFEHNYFLHKNGCCLDHLNSIAQHISYNRDNEHIQTALFNYFCPVIASFCAVFTLAHLSLAEGTFFLAFSFFTHIHTCKQL